MEINDERFSEFLGEFREFRGEVKSEVKNLHDHVGAVSKKADKVREELSGHLIDENAHGRGVERRASDNVGKWVGWVVAVVGLSWSIWHG